MKMLFFMLSPIYSIVRFLIYSFIPPIYCKFFINFVFLSINI